MKTKKISIGSVIASLLLSILTPLSLAVPRVSAAADTCTWTGAGSDDNFSTALNWTGCDGAGIPENGDVIEFDMTVPADYNESIVNDMTGLSVAGINLTGAGSSNKSYVITGEELIVTGDMTGDQESGVINLNSDVTLGASVSYSVPDSALNFGLYGEATPGVFDLSTYDFTFESPADECSGLSVLLRLAGSGDIITATGSSSILLMEDQSSYTGAIVSNGSGVAVANTGALTGSNTVTINGSGSIYLIASEAATFTFDLVMNSTGNPSLATAYSSNTCSGGGGVPEKSTTTLDGDLTLNADTVFSGTNDLNVTGTFTDNDKNITVKSGSAGKITTSEGTVEAEAVTTTINADDKTSGFETVDNKETLILKGERGYITVNAGGILKGTGTVTNTITVNDGGTLAPGESPGCLSSGGLILAGTFEVELAGSTVCTEYDQSTVTGAVDVTGGTLNVSFLDSYMPALNSSYTIISNDAADAVTGTFTDLADGGRFDVSGVTFEINYDGGDGNDVVLTAVAVATTATAPDTGAQSLVQNPITMLAATAGLIIVLGGIAVVDQRKK